MSWLLHDRERKYVKARDHNQFTLMDRFRAMGFVPPELTRLEKQYKESPENAQNLHQVQDQETIGSVPQPPRG